jgi:hypothetical protein
VQRLQRDAHVSFKHWSVVEGFKERQLSAFHGFAPQVVAAEKGITKKRDATCRYV